MAVPPGAANRRRNAINTRRFHRRIDGPDIADGGSAALSEKSIRFIAPYAPGGSTDLLTRMLSWYCVVAPAGTPKIIIDRLNAEIVKALDTPEMRQRLADEGTEVEPSMPAQLARFVRAEIAKWGKAVKDSGARLD